MTLRDDILSHTPTIEPVQAFGRTVYVREMTGHEVREFQRWISKNPEREGIDTMVTLLVRTLCDEQGNRQFEDDDTEALIGLPTRDLQAAYAAAEALNTVTNDDVEAAQGN